MNILLVCALGMSTSLLVKKMQEYCNKAGIENVKIDARSISEVKDVIGQYDAVLLAPQVRFQEGSVKDIIHNAGKEYALIPTVVYGRLDGKAAMELALSIVKKEA